MNYHQLAGKQNIPCWELFPHVAQAHSRLIEALFLNTYTISRVSKEESKWKCDDLKSIMSKLVEFGCLDHRKLIDDMGVEVVSSLIEYNILHYRSVSRILYDIPKFKGPIVTAESGCSLYTMELVLKQY